MSKHHALVNQEFEELLALLKQKKIDIPSERLDLIFTEYSLLCDQMEVVRQLTPDGAPTLAPTTRHHRLEHER